MLPKGWLRNYFSRTMNTMYSGRRRLIWISGVLWLKWDKSQTAVRTDERMGSLKPEEEKLSHLAAYIFLTAQSFLTFFVRAAVKRSCQKRADASLTYDWPFSSLLSRLLTQARPLMPLNYWRGRCTLFSLFEAQIADHYFKSMLMALPEILFGAIYNIWEAKAS